MNPFLKKIKMENWVARVEAMTGAREKEMIKKLEEERLKKEK
jgi:hypothetical protein